MQPITDLSLSLLYADDVAGTWTCRQLSRGLGVIQSDDLTPDAFYDARGGLRAATGRHFTFLETTDGVDLVSYVNFLLTSTTTATSSVSPRLEGEGDVIAAVISADLSVLRLRFAPERWVLDFLNPRGEAPGDRESPYFNGLPVDPHAWQEAARVALREYRAVIRSILRDAPGPDGRLLRDLHHRLREC